MHKLNHSQIAQLAKKAQQGDDSAFAALYAATVQNQLYFATAFLQDSFLAEDAVQTAYMSMYEALPRLENPKLFVAYLNRICYNTCVDIQKKAYRHQDELDEDSLTYINDSSDAHNPADRYLVLEQSHEIYRALATLPQQQQAMFLLRYHHDMKLQDVAFALDCSESTVKRGLKAAAATLEQMLRPNSTRRK